MAAGGGGGELQRGNPGANPAHSSKRTRTRRSPDQADMVNSPLWLLVQARVSSLQSPVHPALLTCAATDLPVLPSLFLASQ